MCIFKSVILSRCFFIFRIFFFPFLEHHLSFNLHTQSLLFALLFGRNLPVLYVRLKLEISFGDSSINLYFNYKIVRDASNVMKPSGCVKQFDWNKLWTVQLYPTPLLSHIDNIRKCKIVIPSRINNVVRI
jgi:hypothetical protein